MATADEAWEEMKSPEAAKTKAYRRRVEWILAGSKRENRSARIALKDARPERRPEHRPSARLGSEALEIPDSKIGQARADFLRGHIGDQEPRGSIPPSWYAGASWLIPGILCLPL